MLEALKSLIEALRDEMKNYGEMLVLLDQQQTHLLSRAVNEVSHSINLVQAHGAALEEARERREQCRHTVARKVAREENIPFSELIPLLPGDYQPLLQALVNENNELLFQIRRRARQNNLMLRRSVELMQQVIHSLGPSIRSAIADSPESPDGHAQPARQLQEQLN